jgi:hypothetical protein
MIQYGLISKVDAGVIEKTLDLIIQEFAGDLFTTEVGIYSGKTSMGICNYVWGKYRKVYHTGIDNFKDGEVPGDYPVSQILIRGNSSEVYNQLEDNSQHLIFIDGCHCFAHVVSDFFCYAPKVKEGGFIAFHDTGRHIGQFKDFQHGDKNNPDAYISVRKALQSIGLLSGGKQTLDFCYDFYSASLENWSVYFDEADENDEAGGICVFKKVFK